MTRTRPAWRVESTILVVAGGVVAVAVVAAVPGKDQRHCGGGGGGAAATVVVAVVVDGAAEAGRPDPAGYGTRKWNTKIGLRRTANTKQRCSGSGSSSRGC